MKYFLAEFQLPFILMHPKPNMKKIMKADTMNDNADYKVSLDEPPSYCDEYCGKNKDVQFKKKKKKNLNKSYKNYNMYAKSKPFKNIVSCVLK